MGLDHPGLGARDRRCGWRSRWRSSSTSSHFTVLQRHLRRDRRRDRADAVVLPVGAGGAGRRRAECRNRTRVPVRERPGRKGRRRKEDDRRRRRTGAGSARRPPARSSRRWPAPTATSTPSCRQRGPSRRRLRLGRGRATGFSAASCSARRRWSPTSSCRSRFKKIRVIDVPHFRRRSSIRMSAWWWKGSSGSCSSIRLSCSSRGTSPGACRARSCWRSRRRRRSRCSRCSPIAACRRPTAAAIASCWSACASPRWRCCSSVSSARR